jgi:hypothetical protein
MVKKGKKESVFAPLNLGATGVAHFAETRASPCNLRGPAILSFLPFYARLTPPQISPVTEEKRQSLMFRETKKKKLSLFFLKKVPQVQQVKQELEHNQKRKTKKRRRKKRK